MNKGPALSRKSEFIVANGIALPALLLASQATACMSARPRARGLRQIRVIQN
jgi:hypothetical protein